MKKLHSFILLSLLVFFITFSLIPRSVFADGLMIKHGPYSNNWDYLNEDNQQAFINYDDGLQKMIISINFKQKKDNSVVWLFPVPSNPDKVAIDIVENLPKLNGEEISKSAKSNLNDTTRFLQTTQLYTIPLILLRQTLGTAETGDLKGTDNTLGDLSKNTKQDIVVHEHLEKKALVQKLLQLKPPPVFIII